MEILAQERTQLLITAHTMNVVCSSFELQELSALAQFLSDAEKNFYDRIKSKIKLESVVTLVYSYFVYLCFVSLLKVSNACAAGAWDDFV